MSVNWIRLGKELSSMPNGVAVLRVLQAHKIDRLVETGENHTVSASCTIEIVIDYAREGK